MHLPGYFSLRDLNDNMSNTSSWPLLLHQDKTSDHYYDLFTARPKIDYNFDKEHMRQTILKHETIFQHQLHELHRLHKTQRDMMNEIQAKELHGCSCPFSFSFLSQNGRNGCRSGFNSIQSGLKFNNGESLESKCRKLQRRLFDLELPADKYHDDDGDEVIEVSVNAHQNSEVNPEISRKISSCIGVISSCNGGDVCSPNLYSARKSVMIDLNEIVLDDEPSASAHHSFAKKSALKSCDGREGTGLMDLQMETARSLKASFRNKFENGHDKCKGSSFSGISCHNNLDTPYKSSPVEHGNLYPNRTEPNTKKKIFGVEISEANRNSSKCLKILGVPVFEKHCDPENLPSSSSLSKSSSSSTVLLDSAKFSKARSDPSLDPTTPNSEEKQSVNGFSDRKLFIDLNMCVEEGCGKEEAPLIPSSLIKNSRRVEIDLEIPACIETETSESESLENKPTNQSLDGSQDSKDDKKELSVVAAEALVSISLSDVRDLLVNGSCQPSEASPFSTLQWFADVISSLEIGSVSTSKDRHVDIIPNALDYFEYMTLKLVETKVEEYTHKTRCPENPEIRNMTQKLPRRGLPRRGRRQRKDFQRDLLPSLTSLSRNEVIDDLQTIEGLIKEAGGQWQSGLTHKTTGKRFVRGRKRSCSGSGFTSDGKADAAHTHTLPVRQGCRESRLEETDLIRWGKRTRRPPRQRCMTNNNTPLIALK